MQPNVKLLRCNMYEYLVQDLVPAPGEIICCHITDTDQYLVKIGDGKTVLPSLPNIVEEPMYIDCEFSAPWINKMISYIPEEVWEKAEKAVKKRKSIYHISEVIVESVRFLSEEYCSL